ncbi:MAG: hypothetical protein IKW63_04550 [Elusimicrobiaceae bacterium]|nr:hypothetical protein [Elusimicrobiaceae bacterium]
MAENKKDSFTFSDKIKNSKPAFNPFSKRVSSKIGNNGKPKKTLFERTRRDAPFFVAAAAALLMLPFLYKYSGSVEDGEIITPGTDSVFEPDRSGFDPSLEDPSAQIAQLSVRDPLSLIKGWGDPEPAPSVGSYDRDGMDDTYTPPARSYRNESPYRQQAPAASRAAFQRQAPAPTKVGKLGSASMNLRGGGGGFGRFGGANLKTAAKASSAEAPKAGVKPVSLQPLRAAGNPSRSYFGQGSAAQARASRDAMGKSNALQALTDAMYDPLKANQAPLGGLGGGDFVGGAGAGKWDPHSEYKGITPWWWDMMKQQEMEKWKWKYFLWKKNFIEPLVKALGEIAATAGKGLACCVVMGTDDCDVGRFAGVRAGAGSDPECGNLTAADWNDQFVTEYGEFSEANCYKWGVSSGMSHDDADALWSGGDKAGVSMGPLSVRVDCITGMGWANKNAGDPDIKENNSCSGFKPNVYSYRANFGGKANKGSWQKYHYVVARNYVPGQEGKLLCSYADNGNMTFVGKSETAIRSDVGTGATPANGRKDVSSSSHRNANRANDMYGALERSDIDPEDLPTSCVIYVAHNDNGMFDYKHFQQQTMKVLEDRKLCVNDETKENYCENVFNQLDLFFIESFATRWRLASGNDKLPQMPMLYQAFMDSYLSFRRVASDREQGADTNKLKIDTRTERKMGENAIIGGRCYFDKEISLSCENNTNKATLHHKIKTAEGQITVKAMYRSLDQVAAEGGAASFQASSHEQQVPLPKADKSVGGLKYDLVFDTMNLVRGSQGGYTTAKGESGEFSNKNGLPPGTIIWKAYRGGRLVGMTSCDYNNDGLNAEAVIQPDPPEKVCTDGETKQENIEINGVSCAHTFTCSNNSWGQPVKNDPNCGESKQGVSTPVAVSFYDQVGQVLSVNDPLDGTKRTNPASSNTCTNFALDNRKLLASDDTITKLLSDAKIKYDQANNSEAAPTTLSYQEQDITVANLLDAMSIVKEGIPVNAVCMLGKTIGAASSDPKGGNNMFGSFAAFMGEDSSFFPALRTVRNGQTVVDQRFIGCQNGQEYQGNKAYHYGHYNWNHARLGDQANNGQNDRAPFVEQLQSGMWKDFPLKPIADAVGFQRSQTWDATQGTIGTTDSMDQQNRKAYHKAYKNVFQTNGSCNLNSSATMTYEQVKTYIQALCNHGTNVKPTNGNQLECNRRFKADNIAHY